MSAYGRSRTLLNLIADAVFLADLPSATATTAVSKQNCTDNLNAGIAELYDAICEAGADEVYTKNTTVTTDGRNPSEYSLAIDFSAETRRSSI